jgi:hypothetical protein
LSDDNELKDYGPRKAVVNATVQWPDMRLSEPVKHVRLFRDKENNIIAMPVILLDPTQTGLNVLPMGRVGITDPAALNSYARVYGLPCCGWPETTMGLVTHSTKMVQKGAMLEAERTPTIMRTVNTALAGGSAIWTPALGNRFHLQAFQICLGIGCTTAAAALLIQILDQAAPIFRYPFSAGALAATTEVWSETITLPGNGYESAVVNNVLTLNLSVALTAGSCSVTAFGFEDAY